MCDGFLNVSVDGNSGNVSDVAGLTRFKVSEVFHQSVFVVVVVGSDGVIGFNQVRKWSGPSSLSRFWSAANESVDLVVEFFVFMSGVVVDSDVRKLKEVFVFVLFDHVTECFLV